MRVLVASLGIACACGARPASAPLGARGPASVVRSAPAPLDGRPERLLHALRQPWSAFASALGPHRLRIRARSVRSGPGLVEARVVQTIELVWARGGRLALRKDTHDQYGLELRWLDGWLYLRQRWNRFLRRRPLDAQEPLRLADRAYGLLPDELELLGRSLALGTARAVTVLGRAAWQVVLARAESAKDAVPGDPDPRDDQPARRWRRSLRVEALSGTASIDRLTGAPLLARLRARCSFASPAGPSGPTGLPALARAGGARGWLEIELEQQIAELGGDAVVVAPLPEEVVADPRGRRLEVERQMVLGERPLDPAWPRLSP